MLFECCIKTLIDTIWLHESYPLPSGGNGDWKEVLRQFWDPLSTTAEAMSTVAVRDVIDVMDEMLAPHLFPELVRADFGYEITPRQCCVHGKKEGDALSYHSRTLQSFHTLFTQETVLICVIQGCCTSLHA